MTHPLILSPWSRDVPRKTEAALKPPYAPEVFVVLVGELVAGAALSRAILFSPREYPVLLLFRRAFWVSGDDRLHYVQGQILLFAGESRREYPVLDAG